ncbi:MAG: hypothetical protein AAGC63_09695 [Propionicimonas sp.]|nr:hypothetical protein [Propionicimonas sp.]
MSEIVRDPNRLFLCPRCGRPVTYKGRGRRPVWCSARCRVEASIERRGNRIVGVEPRVVTVVPPKQRLSQWEKERRQEIVRTLTHDIVVAMVAQEPYLLLKVLTSVGEQGLSGSDATRQTVAKELVRTAHALAPGEAQASDSASQRPHKRDADEWVALLNELAAQLANGQFYNRDLPSIDEPLAGVVDRYLRRRNA